MSRTHVTCTINGDEVDFLACNPGYPQGNLKGYFNTWLRLSKFQAYFDVVDGVYKGDPASELPLFNIRLYNNSHRGGGPTFGSDGLLYLAVGDQYRETTAQDIENTLEGGVLRARNLARDTRCWGPGARGPRSDALLRGDEAAMVRGSGR